MITNIIRTLKIDRKGTAHIRFYVYEKKLRYQIIFKNKVIFETHNISQVGKNFYEKRILQLNEVM